MKIVSKVKDYQVEVVHGIFNEKQRIQAIAKTGRIFYFIDASFQRHYKDDLQSFTDKDYVLSIEAHENNKSYLKLADYYKVLIEAGFRKNDVLVTLGGGILQDISGFIASTLYRGIKWVFIPTTLLAQADSCIGSKTSINFGDSKNLIGTFYPPDLILIDIDLTATLTDNDFYSGVGEVIKFHLLSDQSGYGRLKAFLNDVPLRKSSQLPAIIASTLEIKKSYFEKDEFDTGIRNLLNYGHCFGHALESASDFKIPHGIAVIIGMGFANLLSLRRSMMSQEKYEEIERLLKPFYPSVDWNGIPAETILQYMKKDKKRVSLDLTMILLSSVGHAMKYDNVAQSEVTETYHIFIQRYSSADQP